MSSLNISLPEPLAKFVEEQAHKHGYHNSSEYVESLIQADQRKQAKAELEAKLVKGLDSEPIEITDATWDSVRQSFDERHRHATPINAKAQ
jgi:antitoxin ParD1/3/4